MPTNLENKRRITKQWKKNNPLKVKEHNRKAQLRYKYGLSSEEYDSMLEAQDGVCAICKSLCSTGKRLSVDHCHTTGKIRALLCYRCNSIIGAIENEGGFMDYLKKHGKEYKV